LLLQQLLTMDAETKYDLLSSKAIGDTTTYKEIKAGMANSELSHFNDARADEAMWIEFEMREVEIIEGVYKCRCGSKKVYTAREQRRGGDGGMTFYAMCVRPECGRVWTI